MIQKEHDFQVVILDSPYEIWDQPLVSSLFSKMVRLKKQGYEDHYVRGVLPVDTSDYLATHILLCERGSNGSLEPVMGFKSITVEKCREYSLGFSGLSLVQNAKMPLHSQAVENIIQRCDREMRRLAYFSSWTIDTKFKKEYYQRNNKDLNDAFCVFYLGISREQDLSEVILGGTLRFHTEQLFFKLGHQPLSLNGQQLSPIHVAHLAQEPVLVMHSSVFPEISLASGKKWERLWNERIHLEKAHGYHQMTKKAA